MRTEDVHDHSVNRLWVVEESAFPCGHPPPPSVLRSFVAQCGLLGRKTLMGNSLKDGARAEVESDLSSLRGRDPSYLCCRMPWELWLFDRASSEGNDELLRPDLATRWKTKAIRGGRNPQICWLEYFQTFISPNKVLGQLIDERLHVKTRIRIIGISQLSVSGVQGDTGRCLGASCQRAQNKTMTNKIKMTN